MTVGGDRLDYDGNTSTDVSNLNTIKIHWNSVLSTPKAKYMIMDISNMYLNTKLPSPEFMRLHLNLIPQEIIDKYQPSPDNQGYCYFKITRAIYGLKQAGALANADLIKHLAKHDYIPMDRTPGLFKHKTRPISFTLVVDDFGVKYVNLEDAKHLEQTLKTYYPIKSDWKGDKYIGIDLDWNNQARTLRTSMKGYIKKALKQFQHPEPSCHTYGSEIFVAPIYGKAQ
jgi:hypothetical protein